MIQEGLVLTAVGMGGVFVFLCLLIVAMVCMSWFVRKFFPGELPKKTKNPSLGQERNDISESEIALAFLLAQKKAQS